MKRVSGFLIALAVVSCVRGANSPPTGERIVAAARQQIGVTTEYDPAYKTLEYPGGDIPIRTGVCSDVVVRSLRGVGVDLQKEVHEDMLRDFSAYPQKWGLKGPDKNIDHRRVANLMRYFQRQQFAVTNMPLTVEIYRPGDIVAWDLGNGVLHMGMVSDSTSGTVPLIIHNIGSGAKEEDVLLKFQVIGHYRLKDATPAVRGPITTSPARTNRVTK